jgi:hypothetical protein
MFEILSGLTSQDHIKALKGEFARLGGEFLGLNGNLRYPAV